LPLAEAVLRRQHGSLRSSVLDCLLQDAILQMMLRHLWVYLLASAALAASDAAVLLPMPRAGAIDPHTSPNNGWDLARRGKAPKSTVTLKVFLDVKTRTLYNLVTQKSTRTVTKPRTKTKTVKPYSTSTRTVWHTTYQVLSSLQTLASLTRVELDGPAASENSGASGSSRACPRKTALRHHV
jgi:hypothetical protein